ncbi:MAG: hypothetical protein M3004_02575 [Bacteroidota bacterium]|nr:hypothetical protein [Bacteroidota bacterium]
MLIILSLYHIVKSIIKKYNIHAVEKNIKQGQILLLLFISCIYYNSARSQERKLSYDVIKNGNVIGKINFLEITKDQKKILSLTSDVKTRFVFSFIDQSTETAAYEDGIMVYASFYQRQTGSDKVDKITMASGNCYKLMNNGVSKMVTCSPIQYNTLLLYNKVPQNINKVYSDNFQKLLDIKKVEENKYKLSLPDGNFNYYTYKNGVCNKVIIERTFFTIQFVLRENQ